MAKNKGKDGFITVLLIVVFLLAAVTVLAVIMFSKQCGGSRQVQQVHIEMPETTASTTTTTTTITTTTTTTTMITTTTTKAIDYEMKMDISYVKEYKAVNPDIVGWIYIEDTPIDYPVVRYATDNAYYIQSDWKGNYNFAGCIYEDFRGDIEDTNLTLIYGHNMGDGSMFHGVKYFLDEEFGKEHPYFEIGTEDKRYLYEVLAVSVLYGESGADFPYWMPYQKTDLTLTEEDFEDYVKSVKNTAQIWYQDEDYLPEYGDKIVGLQTCYSGSDDGMRCILFAKQVGER